MPTEKPLPYPDDFSSADEYVDSLLHFATTSTLFQTLCGGVHILDFFIGNPSLYHKILPEEWRGWLLDCPEMDLLDLLLRDDLSLPRDNPPPESLIKYIQEIRKHSLLRGVEKGNFSTKKLPSHVAVGMIPKKVHEVTNFADYVVRVADSVKKESGKEITHFVDFGSGQNYLGRTLASPPWNRWIVAVESKGGNIEGAKNMDVLAGMAEREKVMRNKKVFREKIMGEVGKTKRGAGKMDRDEEADLRPARNLQTIYTPTDGKGYIQYVEHRVEDGDLSDVVSQIEKLKVSAPEESLNIISEPGSATPAAEEIISRVSDAITPETNLMAISIHSCGNLSHHGIRSLLLNPSVHAIAIVGCCYNLLSERLTSPSYKHPLLRPNLRALNLPTPSPSSSPASADPHGFPMSNRLATYNETGITLNITSRMMGVQAPANWTAKDSDSFFTRHFYRALLQKLFLDYGVVQAISLDTSDHANKPPSGSEACDSPECSGGEKEEKSITTTPIIIGSLRKTCYSSFTTYVRGAIQKLAATSPSSSSTTGVSTSSSTSTSQDPLTPRTDISSMILSKLRHMSDSDIEKYSVQYSARKKELSIMWSLMAFSAGVVESMIVTDRYLFLREAIERGECRDAWVEGVFEYAVSPRNLVVVGVK